MNVACGLTSLGAIKGLNVVFLSCYQIRKIINNYIVHPVICSNRKSLGKYIFCLSV
jgi:hypothetical protein